MHLGHPITGLRQLRHSLGHDLADSGRLLPSFVVYLQDQGLRTVTIEAALVWAQHPSTGQGLRAGAGPSRAPMGHRRHRQPCDPPSSGRRDTGGKPQSNVTRDLFPGLLSRDDWGMARGSSTKRSPT